jgi:hypothetical protein
MIKKQILLILLGFLQLSGFAQQIEFFYVGGKQDKPFATIIVSMEKKIMQDYITNIIVSDEVYNMIKQYVLVNNTYLMPILSYEIGGNSRIGIHDFGCYAVEISEDADNLLYFMNTRKKSIQYFKGLTKLLDKKEYFEISKVFHELIINRIDITERNKEKSFFHINFFYGILGVIIVLFILIIFKNKKLSSPLHRLLKQR